MSKEKKQRTPGKPQVAIKLFQEWAADTQDPDKIVDKAKAKGYPQTTINTQIGRLRGMGLLPPVERAPKEKKAKSPKSAKVKGEKKAKKAKASKPKKSGTFNPVPKPGQEAA